MALQWEGEIANASEFNAFGTVQGRLYCSVSRSNNTISVSGIYVGHKANSGGVYYDWEWQADAWANGSKRLSNAQTKGRTGGAQIGGNWYYSGTASHSFSVGTGSGSFSLQGNWESAHYGDSSGAAGGNVSYPAAGSPSINTDGVSNIEKDSAKVSWTSSNGTYCTFSSMKIDYGIQSYGSTKTGLAADGNTTLTGLTPGKLYYYRLTVTNGAGLTDTETGTFETLPQPSFLPILLGRL